MSCDELCKHSSVKERNGGGGSLAKPRQQPVCAEYTAVTLFVVVGLRATTTDALLHVAGAVLLACCWRWQNVVAAAAFLHWLACRLQLYIFDSKQLWDFETDAIIIIFTDTWGRYSNFYAVVDGVVMFWFYVTVVVRCGNVVPQKVKPIITLVSANIFIGISHALSKTQASNTRTYPAWFKANFEPNVLAILSSTADYELCLLHDDRAQTNNAQLRPTIIKCPVFCM